MSSLTPSQTVLALAMINMFANFGGFVGNYVIAALKDASGNYYGAVWMMGGIMVFAAALVTLFPMSWAQGPAGSEGKQSQAASAAAGEGQKQEGGGVGERDDCEACKGQP